MVGAESRPQRPAVPFPGSRRNPLLRHTLASRVRQGRLGRRGTPGDRHLSPEFLKRATCPPRASAGCRAVPRVFRGQQKRSRPKAEFRGSRCRVPETDPGAGTDPAPPEGHGHAGIREGERGRQQPPSPRPQTPAPLGAAGQVPPGPPLSPPPGREDD